MKLKRTPELLTFLSTYLPDADAEQDEQLTRDFAQSQSPERIQPILAQIRQLLAGADLPLEEFGSEANRWFGSTEDAAAWLRTIEGALAHAGGDASARTLVVKDSNGTPLSEGDSVTVIKDLKVRGGSSDLKRGTMIKKIHLVEDPEVIECRVDGSTLVLKTCFLKKA